jgi:hypothetical protein
MNKEPIRIVDVVGIIAVVAILLVAHFFLHWI